MNRKRFFLGVLCVAIVMQIPPQAKSADADPVSSIKVLADAPQATVSAAPPPKDKFASAINDQPATAGKVELASAVKVEPKAEPAPEPDENCIPPCCCESTCCNMCPCTYGYVEALIMQRTHGDPVRDILIDGNTGHTVLSSSDLDFSYAGGVRAVAGFCCDCVPVEVGYFGLFDAKASATVVAQPGEFLTFPGDLGPAFNVFSPADRVQVTDTTGIESGEISYHCCCCCSTCGGGGCGACARSIEWLTGFRYLNLRDKLRIEGQRTVAGAVETGFYDVQTENNLFGGQLGVRGRWCYGCWSWEATSKAGIYGNAESEDQNAVDFPNFALRPPVSASGDDVAFVGELNLTGIYQLNQVWAVRAGYNLMWVEGVALAPAQLDFSLTPTSGSQIERNGGLFLQGADVGLEARW